MSTEAIRRSTPKQLAVLPIFSRSSSHLYVKAYCLSFQYLYQSLFNLHWCLRYSLYLEVNKIVTARLTILGKLHIWSVLVQALISFKSCF